MPCEEIFLYGPDDIIIHLDEILIRSDEIT